MGIKIHRARDAREKPKKIIPHTKSQPPARARKTCKARRR